MRKYKSYFTETNSYVKEEKFNKVPEFRKKKLKSIQLSYLI